MGQIVRQKLKDLVKVDTIEEAQELVKKDDKSIYTTPNGDIVTAFGSISSEGGGGDKPKEYKYQKSFESTYLVDTGEGYANWSSVPIFSFIENNKIAIKGFNDILEYEVITVDDEFNFYRYGGNEFIAMLLYNNDNSNMIIAGTYSELSNIIKPGIYEGFVCYNNRVIYYRGIIKYEYLEIDGIFNWYITFYYEESPNITLYSNNNINYVLGSINGYGIYSNVNSYGREKELSFIINDKKVILNYNEIDNNYTAVYDNIAYIYEESDIYAYDINTDDNILIETIKYDGEGNLDDFKYCKNNHIETIITCYNPIVMTSELFKEDRNIITCEECYNIIVENNPQNINILTNSAGTEYLNISGQLRINDNSKEVSTCLNINIKNGTVDIYGYNAYYTTITYKILNLISIGYYSEPFISYGSLDYLNYINQLVDLPIYFILYNSKNVSKYIKVSYDDMYIFNDAIYYYYENYGKTYDDIKDLDMCQILLDENE